MFDRRLFSRASWGKYLTMEKSAFKVGDRVVRNDPALEHIVGVIENIRQEVTTKQDSSGDDLMIFVRWDNGVYSCVSPKFIRHA
ncbi:MAG: nitrile hydratase subunit beta [Deltaproteobacteria bacterium]|nr:nitrile hydratase subunit beta [Deltaproteobacteria bacterium]MCX7952581.1 nitrile hydratase subunit beta [Deltaproteobacteria bacterium]